MKNFIQPFLVFLIFISTLLPEFGGIDRIGFQWLYLSIISLSLFSFLSYNRQHDFKKFINGDLKYFTIFFIFSIFSIFFSENISESIIELSRIFILLLVAYLVINLIYKIKSPFNTISLLFIGSLIIELAFSYYDFLNITLYTKYDFSLANELQGISSNKNITASAILIKLPFLIPFYSHRNYVVKVLSIILTFLAISMIFLLSARAMFVALIIIYTLILLVILTDIKSITLRALPTSLIYFLPFIFSIVVFSTIYNKNNTVNLISRASTVNTEDASTNQRLRFYKHGLHHIIENNIIPSGIGNWKILSIKYDSQEMQGYVVPYHLHNDFLQFMAELGIIGGMFYLIIYLIPIFRNIKYLILKIKNKLNFKEIINSPKFILLLSLIVFFVDSNLNFPFARPMIMVPIILILSLSYYESKTN